MRLGSAPSNLAERRTHLTSEQEDRMTHVKRTIGLVTAVLVLAVTALAVQAQPQFGGTWTLDPSQSQFPAREGGHGQKGPDGAQGQTQPPVVKLVVEQNGANFKVTRSMARDNRERAYTQSFVADGSQRTEQGHRGSSTVTKATLGGDRLVTTSTTTMPGKEGGEAKTFSRESTWTVSPDGRTLSIDTVMHGPHGDKTMKTVYLKS
jgi:hypothetical protein